MNAPKLLGAASLALCLLAAPAFAQGNATNGNGSSNASQSDANSQPAPRRTGPNYHADGTGPDYGNNNGTGGFAQPIYGGHEVEETHTGDRNSGYTGNVVAGHTGGFVHNQGAHTGGLVNSNGHVGGFAETNGTHTGGFLHNSGAHTGGFVDSGAHNGGFVNSDNGSSPRTRAEIGRFALHALGRKAGGGAMFTVL